MRIFSVVVAAFVGSLSLASFNAAAETVAALNQNKAGLAGKTVSAQGKVVKVNNGIMQKNFLHLQDGTGAEGSNDITVTSTETAAVGDEVTITGTLVIDRDFGAGYTYPVIIEQATISK